MDFASIIICLFVVGLCIGGYFGYLAFDDANRQYEARLPDLCIHPEYYYTDTHYTECDRIGVKP